MYLELEIKGEIYKFKFGVGFMRAINKTLKMPIDGVKGAEQEVGLRYAIAGLLDGDIATLINVLSLGNRDFEPRITIPEIEAYIEDEETDIDELFAKVIDFFRNANVTKRLTRELEGLVKTQTQNQM